MADRVCVLLVEGVWVWVWVPVPMFVMDGVPVPVMDGVAPDEGVGVPVEVDVLVDVTVPVPVFVLDGVLVPVLDAVVVGVSVFVPVVVGVSVEVWVPVGVPLGVFDEDAVPVPEKDVDGVPDGVMGGVDREDGEALLDCWLVLGVGDAVLVGVWLGVWLGMRGPNFRLHRSNTSSMCESWEISCFSSTMRHINTPTPAANTSAINSQQQQ